MQIAAFLFSSKLNMLNVFIVFCGKKWRVIDEYITNYVSLKMSSTKKYRASYQYVCKIRWRSEIMIKVEEASISSQWDPQ